MKIIVTHKACDLDAIASSWIIKRFLPGWENAEFQFVPAGGKLKGKYIREGEIIERVGDHDVIHVDTGWDRLTIIKQKIPTLALRHLHLTTC